MKVIVSGLTGSGKSSLAKMLADRFDLKYIPGGVLLKESLPDHDFKHWETDEGLKAIKFRLEHPEYDRKVDKMIANEFDKTRNAMLDSWVAPWRTPKDGIIKIYLKADLKCRAERVAKRDSTSIEEALHYTKNKDKLTTMIYKKLYGFDSRNDLQIFDLVIDDTNLDTASLFKISELFLSKQKG